MFVATIGHFNTSENNSSISFQNIFTPDEY